MTGKSAVVLLSGGLDSTTVLAIAALEGLHAIRAQLPLRPAAQRRTRGRPAGRRRPTAWQRHVIADIDLRVFGGSALTDATSTCRSTTSCRPSRRASIPITYVPAATRSSCRSPSPGPRLSGPSDIFIGVNALDYSGYPDCRPEYIAAFEQMANLATKAGVEGTPATHDPHAADRADQGRRSSSAGLDLGVDYALTHQLLRPRRTTGRACGALRLVPAAPSRASPKPALTDPTLYQARLSGMTYLVKEIFYTLQGEGAHAGRPAVFCRFAGCNLWTGREEDRAPRRSASSATPTSSAPTARAAAASRPPTTSPTAVAAHWPDSGA